MRTRIRVAVIAVLLPAGLRPAWAQAGKAEKPKPAMEIKSSAFEPNADIPRRYTCKGKDVSPPLAWSGLPPQAKSLALICDDPDAPVGTWVHWVLYNLSAQTASLPENVAKAEAPLVGKKPAVQGLNDFGNVGYGGPCPPSGPAHRYFFKLYALDKPLRLGPKARKEELLKAMEGRILGQAELMGKFGS